MDLLVAVLVAGILNVAILLYLQKRYDAELRWLVTLAYTGGILARYSLALFLWLHHTDTGFARTFWGDSGTYDVLGAVVAEGWQHGTSSVGWTTTLEGKANRGFIYFVAGIYFLFGRNTLLVQFVNGIIGSFLSVLILEIGLLLYDRKVAARAMLLTAFFPQMIFWSSALYKDGAVMLCIAANILAALRFRESFRPDSVVLYLVSLAALAFLRFYIFYALVAATVVGVLMGHRKGFLGGLVAQLMLVATIIVLLLATPAGQEMVQQAQFLDFERLQTSRDDLARANSGFAPETDVSSLSGVLVFLPVGVSYLLFSPFPWEITNVRQILALPDVLLWYALMPALARGLLRAMRHRIARTMPILVFTASLTVAYGAFLGNAGTAYRQRTQIMMFFFLFIGDGMSRKPERKALLHVAAPARTVGNLQARGS